MRRKRRDLHSSPIQRNTWSRLYCLSMLYGYFALLSPLSALCDEMPLLHGLSIIGCGNADSDISPVVKESPETIQINQDIIKTAQQLIQDYPDRPDPYYLAGLAHFRLGKSVQAIQYWQQCLEFNPQYAPAYFGLANIKFDQAKYEQALALFQKGLIIFPNVSDVRINIGRTLLSLGRAEEATQALEETLKMYPNAMQAHVILGKAYFQSKKYEKAQLHYETALKYYPNHKDVCYGISRVYARLGQSQKAAEFRKQFAELQSSASKRLEKKKTTYQDDYHVKTNAAEIYLQLGICYQLYKQPGQAERLWKLAAKLNPANPESIRLLATLYRQTERIPEALRLYRDLQRLEPKNPNHYFQAGALYSQVGQFDQAERAFQKSIQLAPDRPEGYRSLILLYIQNNRKAQEAKKLATILVQKSPIALDYFLLARVCALRLELPEARKALAKAIDLDPENEMYKKLYERIRE